MCLWIAGRSHSGQIVGFCGTGNVAHAKACAEAVGEVFRGRERAGYQGVAHFDGHKDSYQSAGKGGIGNRCRGKLRSVDLADDGECYRTV